MWVYVQIIFLFVQAASKCHYFEVSNNNKQGKETDRQVLSDTLGNRLPD